MAFDLKGQLLPLANVRSETNVLMPFTYDLLVKCIKIHGMVYIELFLTWVIGRQTRWMQP